MKVPPTRGDGVSASHSQLNGGAMTHGTKLGCVVLAHQDPRHLRRLLAALDPFPVYLHCDIRSPGDMFEQMTSDLPQRCRVLHRVATGWAGWGLVETEIAGYRAALADPGVSHVAMLSGSDYPLAPTSEISAFLAQHPGVSFALFNPLPYAPWGRSGGMARLRYRHWAYRKHMIRLPVPRRLPSTVVLAGGSAMKILARKHAEAVVAAHDANPDLVRFWRRSWCPDETFIPSVLSTPEFAPDWAREHVARPMWWIGWDGSARKSPPWLGIRHFDELARAQAARTGGLAYAFARKFATGYDTAVLDAIDRQLRGVSGE